MKKMIESLTGGYVSSAKVVDGTLILSLPDALSPVVWRMDLGQVRSSALEVREQKEGTYLLTLKTPRDDVHDIAPFASRAQAVRALMAASRALENGQGQSRPAASLITGDPPVARRAGGGAGKWAVCALVAAIILILIVYMHATPRTAAFGTPLAAAPGGPATVTSNPDAPGVPVSADDFLRQTPSSKGAP